jgi:3-hydroxy acid dehydrogenase / malonic semialdehyde reductase
MVGFGSQTMMISGASSGIGAACAELLAPSGPRLILLARRAERLESIKAACLKSGASAVLPVTTDVRQPFSLDQLPEGWRSIDVLINNAGLSRGLHKLYEGEVNDWEEMIDTNIKGLLYLTRAIVPGMVERGRGHVVNIGSIAGHQTYPAGNVYCGTKAAVRAISEGLKIDLLGTPVRVTNIDPGMVETEFSEVRFHGDREKATKVYDGVTPLRAIDVAETILFALTRPAHVNISEILLVPTDQATPTLVYRRPTDSEGGYAVIEDVGNTDGNDQQVVRGTRIAIDSPALD